MKLIIQPQQYQQQVQQAQRMVLLTQQRLLRYSVREVRMLRARVMNILQTEALQVVGFCQRRGIRQAQKCIAFTLKD